MTSPLSPGFLVFQVEHSSVIACQIKFGFLQIGFAFHDHHVREDEPIERIECGDMGSGVLFKFPHS